MVASTIWLNLTAWCSFESYMLVLIWLCDCIMQFWAIHACPDLTMWLRDAVLSHACLSWFYYVTVWCSYESCVLVLIWLCDCVMQLWVMCACPDLTTCMWLRDAVMSHTCLSWFDCVTAWCSYESYVLVLIGLHVCDCVMQLWVIRACPDLTVWLRDAVMSHMCLSWLDYMYVTAWCSYESYVLVLIWLHVCDCVMQLWVMCACPDLTVWLHDAVLVKDPHFTLAHYRVSSSSVVRASD